MTKRLKNILLITFSAFLALSAALMLALTSSRANKTYADETDEYFQVGYVYKFNDTLDFDAGFDYITTYSVDFINYDFGYLDGGFKINISERKLTIGVPFNSKMNYIDIYTYDDGWLDPLYKDIIFSGLDSINSCFDTEEKILWFKNNTTRETAKYSLIVKDKSIESSNPESVIARSTVSFPYGTIIKEGMLNFDFVPKVTGKVSKFYNNQSKDYLESVGENIESKYVYYVQYVDGATIELKDNENVLETITVEYGVLLNNISLNLPNKDGYTFKGWSLTDGGELIDVNTYVVNGDLTLYAVYEENPSEEPTGGATTDEKPTLGDKINEVTDNIASWLKDNTGLAFSSGGVILLAVVLALILFKRR